MEKPVHPIASEFETLPKKPVSRRTLLKLGGLGIVLSAGSIAAIEAVYKVPKRAAQAHAAGAFPDIQFDIGRFIAPVQAVNGIQFQFGPVFTLMAPAQLK